MTIQRMSIWKRAKKPLTSQAGVTYLFVMILVVVMSVSLMGVTQQWSVIMKRDREAELLFRGTRIKEAIERYIADYEVQKATRPHRWPRTLEDLTKKSPKRYLQAVYTDPITGENFDLIKTGEELHGVRSTSTDVPYDQVHFKNADSYQAIRFESIGASTNCQPNPINPLVQQNCQPSKHTPSETESTSPETSESVPPDIPS
jgi:type II secretory pathway pseudopilin PulG